LAYGDTVRLGLVFALGRVEEQAAKECICMQICTRGAWC